MLTTRYPSFSVALEWNRGTDENEERNVGREFELHLFAKPERAHLHLKISITFPHLHTGKALAAILSRVAVICAHSITSIIFQRAMNLSDYVFRIVAATRPDEFRGPRLSSVQRPDGSFVSKPLEDLFPFLPREEFLSNILIPVEKE